MPLVRWGVFGGRGRREIGAGMLVTTLLAPTQITCGRDPTTHPPHPKAIEYVPPPYRYFIPGDGDEERHPNVFRLQADVPEEKTTLGLIKKVRFGVGVGVRCVCVGVGVGGRVFMFAIVRVCAWLNTGNSRPPSALVASLVACRSLSCCLGSITFG